MRLIVSSLLVSAIMASPLASSTRSAAVGAQEVASQSLTATQVDHASETFSDEQLAFFEEKIRPLLATHCVECHGPNRQESGLRLDVRSALLEGGDSGPAVTPGEPLASLLLEAVRYESFEMPPEGPLTDDEIDSLATWITDGVAWPSEDQLAMIRTNGASFTDADREHWAFQPIRAPAIPEVQNGAWPEDSIDHFILSRLEAEQLAPAAAADRTTWLRRVTFDLTGLPPTPEELAQFLGDDSAEAERQVVERLLESPRFGERWAQHWLDVVRYADSDGYKADFKRPAAWRYRDWVIQAFNEDKPYDDFIREQLAGDELVPDDPQALVATGYLRHWIYEFNQRDAESQWQIILDDVTETTADAFLGLGFSCARCHDHKYDPILQVDYFRLQAFFNSIYPRQDLVVATAAERARFREQQKRWESATEEIRRNLQELEAPHLERAKQGAVTKFQPSIQAIYEKPAAERSTYENQIWHLVQRQVVYDQKRINFEKKLKGESLERWKQLQEQLRRFDDLRPPSLPEAFAVTDWGTEPAVTRVPGLSHSPVIDPGFPVLFDEQPAEIESLDAIGSTGRRTALADWIAAPENPLTARVIVNRIWQQYFGRGLVETANDFGRLGTPPSHPQLLDHLAARLVENNWSLKSIHRAIVTSATYRQASLVPNATRALAIDPENRLLWRMNRKRLDAGQIRDALLAVSGELSLEAGGAPVPAARPRRTVYTEVMRNRRDPLLVVFDYPDRITSVGRRSETITPNQALTLMNNAWVQERLTHLANRLPPSEKGDCAAEVASVMRTVVGRNPTSEEIAMAQSFLRQQAELASVKAETNSMARQAAWRDWCGVLLNTNEFLFVD